MSNMQRTTRWVLGVWLLMLIAAAQAAAGSLSQPIDAALADVSAAARASVLELRDGEKTIALATVVDAAGHAVTKASELPDDSEKLYAVPPAANGKTQGERLACRVIGVDKHNDLALLQVEDAHGLTPVSWAQRNAVGELTRIGRIVISPGYDKAVIGSGIVSVGERSIPNRRVLLGVEIRPDRPGPRVRRLLPDMGAAAAGIKAGDIITHVGDTPTATREDVLRKLSGMTLGDTVSVRILRESKPMVFEVAVAPLPPDVHDRAEHMNRMGGPVSERADGFVRAIQHDTVLTPQQVGGPLVDLDGKVIGINIARAGRVASYALPADLVQEIVAELTP